MSKGKNQPALNEAAKRGEFMEVKRLLEDDADINWRDSRVFLFLFSPLF